MAQNLNSCQESEQDESSEVNSSDSSSNSDNSPSYDILYGAYVEMHEELKKLAKKYMNKKRLILEHEKKIYELQSLIDELNLENETLDLIHANSSCNCTTNLSETPTCENCNVLNVEKFVLKNKIAKFTYSSHNLNNLLPASRNVGYMHAKKSKSNMNQVVYAKMSHQKLSTCFYCGLHGHTSISCNVRMHGIPSGQYMWIQNEQVPFVTRKKGPNITWVRRSSFIDSSPKEKKKSLMYKIAKAKCLRLGILCFKGVLLLKMIKAKFKNLKKGQRICDIWKASNILIMMGNGKAKE
ncbi:hypothetical protein Lal_00032203, partial [Lupinus albus]